MKRRRRARGRRKRGREKEKEKEKEKEQALTAYRVAHHMPRRCADRGAPRSRIALGAEVANRSPRQKYPRTAAMHLAIECALI
jgi:hypothetical protein